MEAVLPERWRSWPGPGDPCPAGRGAGLGLRVAATMPPHQDCTMEPFDRPVCPLRLGPLCVHVCACMYVPALCEGRVCCVLVCWHVSVACRSPHGPAGYVCLHLEVVFVSEPSACAWASCMCSFACVSVDVANMPACVSGCMHVTCVCACTCLGAVSGHGLGARVCVCVCDCRAGVPCVCV